MDTPPISLPILDACLASVAAGTAEATEYAVIAEVLRSCAEAALHRDGPTASDPICRDAERAFEVLRNAIQSAADPDPTAVWTLGWSQDRRAIPTLLAIHREARRREDETLAARALRAATGIAPRELRDDVLEASGPKETELGGESRHLASRWRSAIYNDLYGLTALELLAVATGPGDIATNAATALARRFQGHEHGSEPVEMQPSAHRPLEWSDTDLEAAFLGCLDHLDSASTPNPTIAYAVGRYDDERAAPTLTRVIRRGLETGQNMLVYYGVMALGSVGGKESVPTFEHVASTCRDRTTASMAESHALRYSHEFFAFSASRPRSGRRSRLIGWAEGIRRWVPARLTKAKADRYADAVIGMLQAAGTDDVKVVGPDRPPGSPPVPPPDLIPARRVPEEVGVLVDAFLRRELGIDLRTPTITVRMWPLHHDVIHVRVRPDSAPYRRIVERTGLHTKDLAPDRF